MDTGGNEYSGTKYFRHSSFVGGAGDRPACARWYGMDVTTAKKSVARVCMHVARQVVGWAFIVLGVVGLFLPILQGILFIAIGAILLAPYVRIFRRLSAWIHKRFPGLRKYTNRFRPFKKRPGFTESM